VVEKKATVAGEGRRPDANCDDLSSVAAEEPRASIVNGLVLAIVERWERTWRRCGVDDCDVRLLER
jgi:hypothetical protein